MTSSLCVDYEVVPALANLPLMDEDEYSSSDSLMRMNILLLTRNQFQEIVLLVRGPHYEKVTPHVHILRQTFLERL